MKKKICPSCRYGEFRRINRRGWIERDVLSRLGWFPWECVICRRKKLFRDEGLKSRSDATPDTPQGERQA
jgi:hypothetical protein